jgi:hypothetical protein
MPMPPKPSREPVERSGHAVEYRLGDGVPWHCREIGRRTLGCRDQTPDQFAPAARIGLGRHRQRRDIAAGIRDGQQRAGPLGHRELIVEAGQPRRAGQGKLPARFRLDVELGDLVETAGEQVAGRVAAGDLVAGAGGERRRESKHADPCQGEREPAQRQRKSGADRQS